MAEREPSLGELAEDVKSIAADMRELVARLDTTYVRRDVRDIADRHAEARIAALEERSRWIGRAALTGLVLPILVSVITMLLLAKGGP